MQPLELLAPARSLDVARQAILYGADAVYMGASTHGARASAANSMEDVREAVRMAHAYGARIYVTVNTLVYDDEIREVERLVRECWQAGVDALIVQDMGLLRMSLPPIALHASTQCDIRTPAKAAFLADAGFEQLVLPREFSLDEIRAVRQAVPQDVALEAFVHGALCVSYSGDCQASCLANGRSANRGECAQMCRMSYDLVDAAGHAILRDKYLLSLRDLCRLDHVEDLALAGISSFKIEGRLKDAAYVKNAVLAYREAIDKIIAKYPRDFCQSSLGRPATTLAADVNRAFNRGFTPYFINGRPADAVKMASIDTPKWIGVPVGKVVQSSGRTIKARLTEPLHNGDGLGYFDAEGKFAGFRANRVDGNTIYLTEPLQLTSGTLLYRNRDVERDAMVERDAALRLIPIEMSLAANGDNLQLTLTIEGRAYVTAVMQCALSEAKSDQTEPRRKVLAKLGGTRYEAAKITDTISKDAFVPVSLLAALRRRAVELLDHAISATHHYTYRRKEGDAAYPCTELTYHDNVANRLARQFYAEHGVKKIESAAECQRPPGDEPVVMTTRYCLRRELGACLRQPDAKILPKDLFLRNKAAAYRLEFDCKNCQMKLRHSSAGKA